MPTAAASISATMGAQSLPSLYSTQAFSCSYVPCQHRNGGNTLNALSEHLNCIYVNNNIMDLGINKKVMTAMPETCLCPAYLLT
jgi:hypothetical protein